MNQAIRWLYQQFIGAVPTGQATCYLCGATTPEEHTVARGLADTFNSHYLAACPSSPWLCAACAWYFDGKAAHPDFRKMSLVVCPLGWHEWKRESMKRNIADWLRAGIDQDAYLIVSLSKKKHILLQAPLTVGNIPSGLAIQIEEQQAFLGRATWESLDMCFMELVKLGHNKGEILSGNLYGNTLRKHGRLEYALWLSEQLAWCRNSAILELLSYITIVDKEESFERSETAIAGRADGADRQGPAPPASGMGRDRPGLQEQVPGRDMAAIRGTGSTMRTHDEPVTGLSQPPLW